jgi:hypothetical protein
MVVGFAAEEDYFHPSESEIQPWSTLLLHPSGIDPWYHQPNSPFPNRKQRKEKRKKERKKERKKRKEKAPSRDETAAASI